MRIIINYEGINYSPCGNFDFGQVEDYTLDVINETLSANDVDSKEDIIYPNPTKNDINYSRNYKKLEVVSIDGRVLMTSFNNSKIDISKLSSGIYLIKVYNSDDSIKTFKISKE